MDRRLFIFFALLLFIVFSIYLCRVPLRRRGDPFALSPILQQPDVFDEPFISDARLVQEFAEQKIEFPFKTNDRVAWIGSSSTYIGEWSNAMEFLLRSRHPELNLGFSRHSTGGGTFVTGSSRLPD